jgi:zinc protease
LIASAAAVLAAQDKRHWSQEVRRVQLTNGLTVLMLERGELPIVSVQALYRVGSRNDPPGQTGAAHFVEHMAFRSTEEIAKHDLTNQILRWGGRWNGYTSYDQTVYGSHTPSEYLEWLIYLERQRMRHVRFDPGEVERERTSVIAEERQYQNSAVYTLVEHKLRRAALVTHPYGLPIMGRLPDLEGIAARDLERFYRERYAPNNLILAIVGSFDPEQALALVTKHFDDPRGYGASTYINTIEPMQQETRRIQMRARSGRSHLELVVQAPAAWSTGFPILLALDGVLAGGKAPGREAARPGSRLHRALVESGMATSVTTEVELRQSDALYSVGVDAAHDADLSAIEKRLDGVLQDTMDRTNEDDVGRAVRQVRAGLSFEVSSNRAVANLMTLYEQMVSISLLTSIPQRLNTVTAEDVRTYANEHLAPERRSLGFLIPDSSSSSGSVPARGGNVISRPDSTLDATGVPQVQKRTPRQIPAPKLQIPELPKPAVRRLDNGLTVLALRVPGESTQMRVRIEAGSRFDPPGREGTALLAARVLAGGKASPLRALDDREVNLSVSAFDDDGPATMRNVVEISVTSLPDDLAAVAKAVVPAIAGRAFQADDLARARTSIAGELVSEQDNSRWRANRAVFERLYDASNPYGRPAEGTDASRPRISVADLSAFHRIHYRPERTIVAIAGPLDPTAAIDRIAGVLGGWRADSGSSGSPPDAPMRTSVPKSRQPASASQPRIVYVPLEKEQASIAIGLPGVARRDDDFAALAALNYLLGETGYAGRLGERLVDTGLAYAVYSSMLADRAAGPILITTDAVRAHEAVNRIVATLDEFAKDGVTDAELREAKGFLLGRLLFRFESAQSATAALADLGYFGDGMSPQAFAQRVLALTRTEVSAAARRYYDSSRAVIVIAGRW